MLGKVTNKTHTVSKGNRGPQLVSQLIQNFNVSILRLHVHCPLIASMVIDRQLVI